MKKVLLVFCACMLIQEANAQLALETFNGPGMPSGWTMIKADNNTVNAAAFAAPIPTVLTSQAWMKRLRATGDSAMLTVSNFTPPAKADRWLVTPSFNVTSPNMVIKWEDWESGGPGLYDSVQIWVSTTGGATPSSFTTKIYDGPASPDATPYLTHGASLGNYNGQNIRVAFRNNCYQQGALRIDNVETAILPGSELQLQTVAPAANSPLAYGTVGSNFTISGTVKNNGATNVTSYTVRYKQGANPAVSQTFSGNIPVYGTANFSFTTPYSVTALGDYPIKVWVELNGDANHANDTLNTQITGVPFMPTKKLTFEEATGTWCGWCPRGSVFMDSMYKMKPHQTTLIAVHNDDPMEISAYDAQITSTPGFPGFPAVILDRREVIDPSEMFLAFNAEKNYFGYAEINFTKPVISGTNLSTTVTVKPAINLNGDYRLAMVITEDRVHSTASGYEQVNYYSSSSQNIPLTGAGHNWQTSTNPVPASQMYYEFVARAIVPSPTGAAGSLPSSMTAGTNYTYNFNTTLDAGWAVNKIRVAILLIRTSDGQILNSNSTVWPTDVDDLTSKTIMSLYPNPARNNVSVSFTLDATSDVQIQLIDGMGRVVKDANQHLTAGSQKIEISTADLAAGIYNVKVTTDKGSQVEHLTVIK